MFEWIESASAAWRTVLHVSEWSGLSIGALGAGAVLFLYVPLARKLVIAGAVLVLVGWICVIHGDQVGRADVEAQWADARKAAIAADQERDAMVEQQLEAKYKPQLAALQKQADERKARSDAYERKILTLLSADPKATDKAASCQLGVAALRMRRGQ